MRLRGFGIAASRPRRTLWLALLAIPILALAGCSEPAEDAPPAIEAPPTVASEPGAAADVPFVEGPAFFERPVAAPGRWREFRTHKFDASLEPAQRDMIEQLEMIGYMSGSQGVPASESVVVHERDAVFPGMNFYVSGHAPEAVLMDMDGNELHRWRYDFWKVWPDYPTPKNHPMTQFWRRAHLYENGDILAIYEGLGIIKLDRDSNLLWGQPLRAHHDLEVLPNGDIYVLAREALMVPRVNEQRPILEDFIVVLGADGTEKKRVSLLRAIENSDNARLKQVIRGKAGDFFHTNTLVVLDGGIADVDPAFRRGNVLVYMLGLGTVAVVDLDREAVVWAHSSRQTYKHDPKILPNGNLMIFENHWTSNESSVLEYDSLSDEVTWQYQGTQEKPFFSNTCGTAERLPNGNTLITESDGGRAFEVTPDDAIVWEFYNPHRAGDDGEFIATLFDLVRIPPDFPSNWVNQPGNG